MTEAMTEKYKDKMKAHWSVFLYGFIAPAFTDSQQELEAFTFENWWFACLSAVARSFWFSCFGLRLLIAIITKPVKLVSPSRSLL